MDFITKTPWTDEDVRARASDFSKIQGYTLLNHAKKKIKLALLRYRVDAPPDRLRALLAAYGQRATDTFTLYKNYAAHLAGEPETAIPVVVAVGLSASGFWIFPESQRPAQTPFVAGMAAKWPAAIPAPPPIQHDAIIVLAADGDVLEQVEVPALAAAASPLADIVWESGFIQPHDHLGFQDGTSQPIFFAIQGARNAAPPESRWGPEAPLGLVLAQQPGFQTEFGSFLAYVKFEVDVNRFNRIANDAAAVSGHTADTVKSWMMGRKTGSSEPLVSHGVSSNDFNYDNDRDFAKCPGGAHIRKMNPRKTLTTHNRILRRGAFYQAGGEKGLLFQCFQSDLARGFETLFGAWAPDANLPEPGAGTDGVLSANAFPPAPKGVAHGGPLTVKSFTMAKDGGYFYFPSIPFFTRIGSSVIS